MSTMGYLNGVVGHWVHMVPKMLHSFIALGYPVELSRKILLMWDPGKNLLLLL